LQISANEFRNEIEEDSMITLLATVALATQLIFVTEQKVPQFDVPSCREAQRLDPTQSRAVQSCRDEETGARSELQQQWLSFPAEDRHACTAETETGGLPSYVELLVCLQNAKTARAIAAKSKL
jgi:hypothetical protein